MSDEESLRVTVLSDTRIEVDGLGLTLVLEPEAGEISALVFAGDVLLGRLLVARDGVEVAQAGQWRGVLVEWLG